MVFLKKTQYTEFDVCINFVGHNRNEKGNERNERKQKGESVHDVIKEIFAPIKISQWVLFILQNRGNGQRFS